MAGRTLRWAPFPRSLPSATAQVAAATLLLLLTASAPSYGQAPAACPAPYLSGPNISIPSDRPDAVRIAVSPDGATLYLVGRRRGAFATVVPRVPTGLVP